MFSTGKLIKSGVSVLWQVFVDCQATRLQMPGPEIFNLNVWGLITIHIKSFIYSSFLDYFKTIQSYSLIFNRFSLQTADLPLCKLEKRYLSL